MMKWIVNIYGDKIRIGDILFGIDTHIFPLTKDVWRIRELHIGIQEGRYVIVKDGILDDERALTLFKSALNDHIVEVKDNSEKQFVDWLKRFLTFDLKIKDIDSYDKKTNSKRKTSGVRKQTKKRKKSNN